MIKSMPLHASAARVISARCKGEIELEEVEAEAAFVAFQKKYPIAGGDYRRDRGYLTPNFPYYGKCSNLEDALSIIKEQCELGKENAHPTVYDEGLLNLLILELERLGYKATQCGNDCDTLHINWTAKE